MVYIITGSLMSATKVVAQALMNGLSSQTIKVGKYTVEPHYGDVTKVYKITKGKEVIYKFEPGKDINDYITHEEYTEIEEALKSVKPSIYQSVVDRYFYDLPLLKGDESQYDKECKEHIVHNKMTLRQDFKNLNAMLKYHENAILVTNMAGEELDTIIERFKDVTVIHITRNPIASFLLRDIKDFEVDDFVDDKLVDYMITHLISVKTPGVNIIKFEDMLKNNYFKLDGVKYDLENNLEPYNKFFTKWESENFDLEKNLDKVDEVKELLTNFNEKLGDPDLPKDMIKEMGYNSRLKIETYLKV